jgi:hypothetical protein
MQARRLSCVVALPLALALAAPPAFAQGTTPPAKPEPPRPGEAAKAVQKVQKAEQKEEQKKALEKLEQEADKPPITAPDSGPPSDQPSSDQASSDQASEEAVPPALAALPSQVLMLRAVGPWKTADNKGFVRLVALAEDSALNFYVQWIDDSGKLIETKKLEGADQAPQLALADIRIETGGEESSVYLDTPRDAQGFSQTYVLILGEPGKAQFGPATN